MVKLGLNADNNLAIGGNTVPSTGRPVAPTQGAKGQWVIVPNILWLAWDIASDDKSADIETYLLGMKIDTLSGAISWSPAPSGTLEDDLDITIPGLNYNVISGSLSVTIDKTGLWVAGDLKVHGHDLGKLKVYLIHF